MRHSVCVDQTCSCSCIKDDCSTKRYKLTNPAATLVLGLQLCISEAQVPASTSTEAEKHYQGISFEADDEQYDLVSYEHRRSIETDYHAVDCLANQPQVLTLERRYNIYGRNMRRSMLGQMQLPPPQSPQFDMKHCLRTQSIGIRLGAKSSVLWPLKYARMRFRPGSSRRSPRPAVCTGIGTAGIPRNSQVARGYGSGCRGNTAGMDLAIAGFRQGWIFFIGGDPAGMIDKFGCEKFWSAYSI